MPAGNRLVLFLVLSLLALPSCEGDAPASDAGPGAESASATTAAAPAFQLPHWTFTPDMIFPADRSLLRAEDGVALPDGRLMPMSATPTIHRTVRAVPMA